MKLSGQITAIVAALTVTGLVPTSWLVGHFAAGGHGFDWDAATAAATAYGTLALALVTWRLVLLTSAETSGTLQLAQLAALDQWSRTRAAGRDKIERLAEAVQEVRDEAITLRSYPTNDSRFDGAIARLKEAITFSGHPVNDFSQAELLS